MRGWLLLERLCPATGALWGCVGLPLSRCRAGSPGQSAALFRLGIRSGDAPSRPRALGRQGDTVRGFSPGLYNSGVCLLGFSCAGGGKNPTTPKAMPGVLRTRTAVGSEVECCSTDTRCRRTAGHCRRTAAVQPLPSHTRPLPSATLKRRFLALRAKLPSPFRRAGAAGAARMGGCAGTAG